MGDLKIRPFEGADRETVVALWRAAGLEIHSKDPISNDPHKDIDFCLAAADAALLVGVMNGEIVATAMTGHDGHRGWVYYLGVHPDHQGKGLGRVMMSAVEDWLKARGVPKINLMIRDTNLEVQTFYERLGYATSPRTVMSKWLDGSS